MNNGRVEWSDTAGAPAPVAAFSLFAEGAPGTSAAVAAVRSSIRHTDLRDSPVAQLFFSVQNVDTLQHGIRYGVFRASAADKIVVGRQSDMELGTIMRSVFQTHAHNGAGTALEQVRSLNGRVLAFAVPRVLQEVRMYRAYRDDISTLRTPMERGVIASSKGDRQLEARQLV
jgi:hypothetical protein